MNKMTPEFGAQNLLQNCAKARPGDRLLIAYEPPEFGYFDLNAVSVVSRTALSLGLVVETVDVGFNPDNPHLSPDLLARFEAADIILFLARLGDQLRFSDMPQDKTIVVSFALNQDLFGSGFGNGHHEAFLQIKSEINAVLNDADEVHLTCPAGTDIRGSSKGRIADDGDTSILRFPMSVFTPVPAGPFSGRVAVSFLTGTGSKYYDDYTIEFDQPVHAVVRDGWIERFEGTPKDAARAEAHYDRVAQLFGLDRNYVHSWHAGIHPGCGYHWDSRENWERWGGAAFGNPRILHFHTCGTYAPGEISWNIIDPTITIDGIPYWEDGVFYADRLPGGAATLAQFPCAASLFARPDFEIGFRTMG